MIKIKILTTYQLHALHVNHSNTCDISLEISHSHEQQSVISKHCIHNLLTKNAIRIYELSDIWSVEKHIKTRRIDRGSYTQNLEAVKFKWNLRMQNELQPLLTFAWVSQCSCLDTVGIFCQMTKSKDLVLLSRHCRHHIWTSVKNKFDVWKQVWIQ